MKNLFTSIIVFIGASILLSSCSTELGSPLAKRHYRKGYNIDFAHKRPTSKSKENETSPVNEPSFTSQQAIKPVVEKDLFACSDDKEEAKQSGKGKNNSAGINHTTDKVVIKSITLHSAIVHSKTNAKSLLKNKAQIAKILKTENANEDARSLLWVLITILLILWLVGFVLGGFWLYGGLINLLLAIALILLILWLLRII